MKKKSLLGLMGILFLSITFLLAVKRRIRRKCFGISTTLRLSNGPISWIKYGVSYADEDGYTIIGMALSAHNPELLRAVIKDGADLYRKYKDPGHFIFSP
jgi:hypothetical protein